MNKLNVYSSAPLSLSVVCAFQNLTRTGVQVVVQPLSAMPLAPQPGLRRHALREERTTMQLRLVEIGEALTRIEDGLWRPEAGVEPGLRFEREALLSRVQAITAALGAPGGVGEPAS